MELFNNKKSILKGLSRTFDNAPEIIARSSKARYIIFSDHHRGDRGISDYFKKNEKVYNAALGYYLERGFTLVQLGDVEEFWEFPPSRVLHSYPLTYELEREFYDNDRFIKIHGNHDNLWKSESFVEKYLRPYFPDIRVEEAVRIKLVDREGTEEATLFLTHGHQGTFLSDTLDWFGMFWLRYLQKGILRLFKQKYQTPAWNHSVREEHEKVMFEWVDARNNGQQSPKTEKERVLFIAGHTHHPIFIPGNTPDRIRSNIKALLETGTKKNRKLAARLRSHLEYIRADIGFDPALNNKQSYYFNTGCCSFFDGSITGIEINKGKIKLIKWMDSFNTAERLVMSSEKIKDIVDPDPVEQPAVGEMVEMATEQITSGQTGIVEQTTDREAQSQENQHAPRVSVTQ